MDGTQYPVRGVDYPRTFQEMDEWFRSDAGCREYIRRLRWPDGFACPHCGVIGEPWTMSDGLLRCRSCHGRTSLTMHAPDATLHSGSAQSGCASWPARPRLGCNVRSYHHISWVCPLDLGRVGMLINRKFCYRIFVMGLSRTWVYRKQRGRMGEGLSRPCFIPI